MFQTKRLLCVDVKVVCGSRVFVVMDGCSKQGRHHLKLCQPVLDRHEGTRDKTNECKSVVDVQQGAHAAQ